MKCCPRCKTWKLEGAFGAHRYAKDGKNWWCAACNADSLRLRRERKKLPPAGRQGRGVLMRDFTEGTP